MQLAEVGPRFEMKRMCYRFVCRALGLMSVEAYEIRLGTIEQAEADREWVLAHYTRTSKKRRQL